jgi:hypothetical protein
MYVVLTALAIGYVVRYARRVQADPTRSLVGFLPEDTAMVGGSVPCAGADRAAQGRAGAGRRQPSAS